MHKFDMGQLFHFYIRRLWIIVLVAVLGAGAGWAYSTFMVEPQYESTSTVILDQSKRNADATIINNYMTLLKSRKVLEPIIEQNSLSMDYAKLAQDITIVNEKSTEIITMTVTANDPSVAQTINTELIDSFNLESLGLAESESDEKVVDGSSIIKVIDLASFGAKPTNVKTAQNMLLASGASAAVAIAVLSLIYDYRQNHHGRAQTFARRRSPVVGRITFTQPDGDTVEQRDRNKMALIDREARDILDVLENLDGVTPESRCQ